MILLPQAVTHLAIECGRGERHPSLHDVTSETVSEKSLPLLSEGVSDDTAAPIVKRGKEALKHNADVGVRSDLQLVSTQLLQHAAQEHLSVWGQFWENIQATHPRAPLQRRQRLPSP